MGAGGSIQNMMVTLRNNRNQLRKRSIFKKKGKRFEAEGLGATASGPVQFKPASVATLAAIRAKMQRLRKRSAWAMGAVMAVILLAFAAFGYSFRAELWPAAGFPNDPQICADQHVTPAFNFYIQDAEEWRRKRETHNAKFQFAKAAELFPDKMLALVNDHIAAGDRLLAQGLTYKAHWEYRYADMLWPNQVRSVQRVVRCYQWCTIDQPEYIEKVKPWKKKLQKLDPSGAQTDYFDAELRKNLEIFWPNNQVVVK